MARSNRKVVPESRNMLNQMKYEIATEFGLGAAYGSAGFSGTDTEFASDLGEAGGVGFGRVNGAHLTSRENGSVGGEMTKRLVRLAQQNLL